MFEPEVAGVSIGLGIPGEAVADYSPPPADVIEADSTAFADWVVAQRTAPEWRFEALHAGDTTSDDPGVLMQRIADAEALLTQIEARQASDMARLRSVRQADQRAAHAEDPPQARLDEHGWVASEIGFALGLSENQVRRRLDFADGLNRYRRVADLVREGAVPAWTAQRLVDHLDELAAYLAADDLVDVERTTVAWLRDGTRTAAQLNRRMRRLVLRAKAASGLTCDDSASQAHAARDVRVTSTEDGCAELWARLPEPDALAVAAVLRELTSGSVAEDDARTPAQRRADVLVAAVLGRPGMYGCASDTPTGSASAGPGTRVEAHVDAHIDVTIPVQSLAGQSHDPGEAPGYGLVPAVTVRDLVSTASPSFRGLLFDVDSGHLVGLALDLGQVRWARDVPASRSYQHPAVMEAIVDARDQHCRAPGCHRAAARCDCDHIEPWPRGATSLPNTCLLCRYHHRLKTHAPGWSVDGTGDGDLTWVTPSNRSASTEPVDHRNGGLSSVSDDTPPF